MIDLLREKAQATQRDNLQLMVGSIESLDLDADSMDLVVTNYALHHLRDADKKAVLARAFDWLRPGGQLVIGDMMFGRGSSPRDRKVIATKVRDMARKGPAGWWRILKNVWRFSLRTSEKPISADGWETLVAEAGFDQIHIRLVVQEACVLSAFKPPAS
jgi:ubiquinone/menaquinone biosynthesis C-methylase UbiE